MRKKVITSLEKAKSIFEIKGIEKLTGFKFYYRVRIRPIQAWNKRAVS